MIDQEKGIMEQILPSHQREKKSGFAIAITAVFVVAVFSVIFLSASHASAQGFPAPPPPTGVVEGEKSPYKSWADFGSPHGVCQYYQNRPEKKLYFIDRDTENDCLVRGDMVGFKYVHAYYTGNKFCVDVTGNGFPNTSDCYTVSQTGGTQQRPAEQQQQRQNATPEILEQTTQYTTGQTALIMMSGIIVIVFCIVMALYSNSKRKKLARATGPVVQEKKKGADHNGLAIASFVVGIFTAIASFCLFPWSFSIFVEKFRFILWNYKWSYSLFLLIVGIIGLILGIKGSRSSRKIFAILGIILSILGIIGILLWFALSWVTL